MGRWGIKPNGYRILPGGTAEIRLTQGLVCLVDLADLPVLLRYRWHAQRSDMKFYAVAPLPGAKGKKKLYMHRFLCSARPGLEVDHRNGDSLDNHRSNLREATRVQQLQNRRARHSNPTGFKGVSYHAAMRKFRARITVNGEERVLGYFESAERAARVYDAAARDAFGEFAMTNFPALVEVGR